MSVDDVEAARPTLRVRGMFGVAEPILIAGGRAAEHHNEVLVFALARTYAPDERRSRVNYHRKRRSQATSLSAGSG